MCQFIMREIVFFLKLFITKENIDETSKLAQPRYRDLHDIVLG